MNTKLMPGAAARLQRLGLHRTAVGRFCNKATLIPPKDGVPIAKNSTELAEMFGDPDTFAKIAADGRGGLAGWVNEYAQQQQGEGTELHRMVATETQRQLANMLKEKDVDGDNAERIQRLNLDPQVGRPQAKMLTSYGQGATYNAHAPGTVLDGKFKSAVDYLKAIWHLNRDPEARVKANDILNAASSVSPADGGFLVPESLRSQLLQISLETSVVRPNATVVPMDSARVPFPIIDVTSHASSVFGGMIAYWGEESAALTDANPKFGRVELDAKKLTGLSVVPNELLQDSIISFSALIERLWPMTLSFEEDWAFMNGNGAGQPLGFLGAGNDAAIAVAAQGGQSADTVLYENVVNMYSRMLPSSLSRAQWLISPDVVPQLFTMALSVGTGGSSILVANAAGAGPTTLFGRPIKVTEKAGALGNRGDISFVDMSYYLVGDRQSMSASSSTDWKFGNDQTAYRIIQRVDGRPWIQSPLTPRNGGNTLSPFVELAAR